VSDNRAAGPAGRNLRGHLSSCNKLLDPASECARGRTAHNSIQKDERTTQKGDVHPCVIVVVEKRADAAYGFQYVVFVIPLTANNRRHETRFPAKLVNRT